MYCNPPRAVKGNLGGDPKKTDMPGCLSSFRSESLHKISLVFASLLFRRDTVPSVTDCWKSIRAAVLYSEWLTRLFSLHFIFRHSRLSYDSPLEINLRRAALYSECSHVRKGALSIKTTAPNVGAEIDFAIGQRRTAALSVA